MVAFCAGRGGSRGVMAFCKMLESKRFRSGEGFGTRRGKDRGKLMDILIVDDERSVRQATAFALEGDGHYV